MRTDAQPRTHNRSFHLPQKLMGKAFALDFDSCDVRFGLGDDSNRRLRAAAADVDLFIFSYVAHETCSGAEANGWCAVLSFPHPATPSTR